MMQFLITGAVIALGVIIYSAWNSDSADQNKNQESMKSGEQGCMWLFIFLGGIILVWIISQAIS